jgi:hypothetical protein
MYNSFSIENFRCIKDLTIGPLARVNLIAGRNNMGKTALLEALWLHSGPNLPDLGDRLAKFRGIPGQDPGRLMHDLFYNFDPERTITLSAKGNGDVGHSTLKVKSQPRDNTAVTTVPAPNAPSAPPRGSQEPNISAVSNTEIVLDYTDEEGQNYVSVGWWVRSESVQIGPNLPFSIVGEAIASQPAKMPSRPSNVFISARQRSGPNEDVQRFGEAELEGYADRIANCLKRVDARIERLRTIAAPPAPMVYADVGLNRPVPISFLGDGVGRLLSMALAFHQARNGMIFIDEVENGLHYSVLKDVWKSLNWLSEEFDVQVFATTHSYECMVAARDAFACLEDEELCIHRLGLQDERIVATTYPFEALEFTLDYGAEIR